MLADYYKILGVTRNATLHEIKKAFRAKAMEFHPDKNHRPDAHEVFVQINQAYEILSDPIKRNRYDYIYFRDESNGVPKYSQAKEERWEETVKQAEETGKEKAEQYAQNYDYFSKRVLKQAMFEIILDFVLGFIFFLIFRGSSGTFNSGLTYGLILFLGGLFLTYKNIDSNLWFIGLIMSAVGFLFMRSRYLDIVRGEDE